MTDALPAYTEMGPTLLSQQPATFTPDPSLDSEDWDIMFNHFESRQGMLRTWRFTWWAYWASLAEYLLPRRYKWLVVANKMTRGSPINNSIIDSTGTLAMYICAAGLWTGLTSPSRPWFKVGAGVDDEALSSEEKNFLEHLEMMTYKTLAGSNFYSIMAQAFQDIATFGTAPVICYEDSEDVVRFYSPCAGEYYLDVGARLSVDVINREFTLNVSQIVEMFQLENCPEQVQRAWEAGGASLQLEFVVMQSIEPNFPVARRGKSKGKNEVQMVPSHFTFREFYWLKGIKTAKPLSMRGFNERPFAVARWSTVSNDPYGRSPGMDALGDVKQLQQETRRKAEFLEKVVRPPMGGDPQLKNEPSSILPGNITYVDTSGGKKGFWPLYEVNPQVLQPLVADITEIQQRIDRTFYRDIFMAISRMEGVQPRNELELTKRDLERLQVLGPFIELFETEFADPILKRVIAIMERRKLLELMPESLKKKKLKISYISILSLAQRSSETVAMKDALVTGGALSSAAKAAGLPDPLRVFNLDKSMRIYAELSNYPSEAIFTEDEVKQQDAARNAAHSQAQQLSTSMAGVNAAKSLSQTPLGQNTALDALLGQGGGGGGQ